MDLLKKNLSKTLIVLIVGLVLITISPSFYKAACVAFLCSAYIFKEAINKLAKAAANKLD